MNAWAIPWEVRILIFEILKQKTTHTLLVFGVLIAIIERVASA